MRTRIKFCGMTREEDVAAAAALGVDAVGLIFAARSPRRLDAAAALALRKALPPLVASVALFMDTPVDEVARTVAIVRPQLLQFHGAEDEADCARHGVPYLRAVPMGGGDAGSAAAFMARYPSAAGFVFDSHAHGGAGGSGSGFDWGRLPSRIERPWLLAGGLRADNVAAALEAVHPWGVDVSSGIESAPGVKDFDSMKRFVAEVRRADSNSPG